MWYIVSEIDGERYVVAELPFHVMADSAVETMKKLYPLATHKAEYDGGNFQVMEFVMKYRKICPIKITP